MRSGSASRSGPSPSVLSRCGPDQLAEARHRRDELLDRARTLAHLAAHDQDLADCGDAGCALADTADAERCALVHRLARLDRPGAHVANVAPGSYALAALRFDEALTAALDAVRRCRQTEHGAGRCWFSALPGVDGCGAILRAAHRLG